MASAAGSDAVSVLDRLTAILEAFDAHDHGLRISELATRAELPKSTVSRLVASLVRQRYLEREGQVVHLGIRLFELGQLAEEPREMRIRGLPVMTDLRNRTGHTVYLTIRDGPEMVCIAAMRGSASPKLIVRIGERVPLHHSAMGMAVLAFGDEAGSAAASSSAMTGMPGMSADPGCPAGRLAEIRQSGLAVHEEGTADGLTSAASPVFSARGVPVGAICASGPTTSFDGERSGTAVRAAARRLTRSLAAPGAPAS